MAGYFRCEEPTRQCPHALTQEAQVDHEGVCPIGNPDCEKHRRPVSWWVGLWERHPKRIWLGSALIIIPLIALFITTTLSNSGWKSEYDNLQLQLAALNKRLDTLDNHAISSPPSATGIADLNRLLTQALALRRESESPSLENAGPEGAQGLKRRWEALDALTANLALPFGSDIDTITRQTAARQLLLDYENLEEQAETLRFELPPGDITAEQVYDDMASAIIDGISRARRLGSSSSEITQSPAQMELIEQIKDTMMKTRESIDRLSAKPVQPFPIESAGLVVVANQLVAESLVLPLLQERFEGKATDQTNPIIWFFPSDDPVVTPGAVITIVEDDPYIHILDGTVDLVFSDQPPSTSVIERFAQAFDGANLASRAFSEIVALDAVALLAHPDAPVVPITPTSLTDKPWLVRLEDSASIRQRIGNPMQLLEVEDPFVSLVAEPSARALALYHQCDPGLAARYLPYQPGEGVPALATSPFSIATEDYGLSFRITATHGPDARPSARKFIDYLTSEQGQERIAAAGFVDLRLRHQEESVDPAILATLAKAVGRDSITSANRYSTNLRFGINEHELDIKAQADIGRLPRSLAREFPNGTVVALGFTDSTGTPAGNHSLSIKRAEHVAMLLRQFKINATAAGLGQQFPIDTNGTDQGRSRNRRVEVWVIQ